MCNSKSAPTVSPKTEADSSPKIEIGTINEISDHSIHLPTVFGCVIIAATLLVIVMICIFARRYKRIFFQESQQHQWRTTTRATVNATAGPGKEKEEDRNPQDQRGGQVFRYHPTAERMVPATTWDENLGAIGAGAPIGLQGIGRTATCGTASRHQGIGIGMPIPQQSVQMVALPTSATGGTRPLQWFPSHMNLPQLMEAEADNNRIVDLDSMEERYRTHQGRVDRLEKEIARIKKRVDPSPPPTPGKSDTLQGRTRGNNSAPAATNQSSQGPAAQGQTRRRASAGWERFLKTSSHQL